MSYDKISRQLRRKATYNAMMRQVSLALYYNDVLTEPSGHFRKRKAFNCGRARCKFCTNPRRLWGYVTHKEHSADESFQYEMSDI